MKKHVSKFKTSRNQHSVYSGLMTYSNFSPPLSKGVQQTNPNNSRNGHLESFGYKVKSINTGGTFTSETSKHNKSKSLDKNSKDQNLMKLKMSNIDQNKVEKLINRNKKLI
jgi:hypothetical protein